MHLQTKTQYVTQIEIDDRAQNNRAPLTINWKCPLSKKTRENPSHSNLDYKHALSPLPDVHFFAVNNKFAHNKQNVY